MCARDRDQVVARPTTAASRRPLPRAASADHEPRPGDGRARLAAPAQQARRRGCRSPAPPSPRPPRRRPRPAPSRSPDSGCCPRTRPGSRSRSPRTRPARRRPHSAATSCARPCGRRSAAPAVAAPAAPQHDRHHGRPAPPPATLMRSRIVGQAASSSSEQNGLLANARLLERGCWARLTPRRKWPEPQYSGKNQNIGISTNSAITSLRAPGSFQNSHRP